MNDPTLPIEISPSEAKRQLSEPGSLAQLIDVRESWEVEISQVEKSTFLPMSQMPASLWALPRDRPLLILCHHGSRSLRVTEFLRANGFPHAVNVGGGIQAWSEQVDPTIPKY